MNIALNIVLKATLVMLAIVSLSSCKVFTGIDYKHYCWESCNKTGQCGTCITHHCEKLCSYCHVNNAACVPCWECLKTDACMD